MGDNSQGEAKRSQLCVTGIDNTVQGDAVTASLVNTWPSLVMLRSDFGFIGMITPHDPMTAVDDNSRSICICSGARLSTPMTMLG